MKQADKDKIYESFLQLGLSAHKARAAVLACVLAMTPPKRTLVVDDFSGLTDSVIRELKSEEQRRSSAAWYSKENHPHGWYRKFEKKHGKRNL